MKRYYYMYILKICILYLNVYICITFLWYCFWDQILFVNKEFNFFIENFCSKRKRIVNFFNYTETRSHLHVYQAIFVINITFLNLNNRGILKESFFEIAFYLSLFFFLQISMFLVLLVSITLGQVISMGAAN